jgi:hypothetical protein
MGFNSNSPSVSVGHFKIEWSWSCDGLGIHKKLNKVNLWVTDKVLTIDNIRNGWKFDVIWLVCSLLFYKEVQNSKTSRGKVIITANIVKILFKIMVTSIVILYNDGHNSIHPTVRSIR